MILALVLGIKRWKESMSESSSTSLLLYHSKSSLYDSVRAFFPDEQNKIKVIELDMNSSKYG